MNSLAECNKIILNFLFFRFVHFVHFAIKMAIAVDIKYNHLTYNLFTCVLINYKFSAYATQRKKFY